MWNCLRFGCIPAFLLMRFILWIHFATDVILLSEPRSHFVKSYFTSEQISLLSTCKEPEPWSVYGGTNLNIESRDIFRRFVLLFPALYKMVSFYIGRVCYLWWRLKWSWSFLSIHKLQPNLFCHRLCLFSYYQWQKLLRFICFKPLLLENGRRYDKEACCQVNRANIYRVYLKFFCCISFRSQEGFEKIRGSDAFATDGTSQCCSRTYGYYMSFLTNPHLPVLSQRSIPGRKPTVLQSSPCWTGLT